MSKSTPSLLALLGLVAVAGYQNRGRISEMLTDAQQGPDNGQGARRAPQETSGNGFLSDIGRMFGAGASGGTLASGLGDLMAQFRQTGRDDAAHSWVSPNPNKPLTVDELEAAIGGDTLGELESKTGLSRKELLLRLNAALPEVVNRFTPEGRLPTEAEARIFG